MSDADAAASNSLGTCLTDRHRREHNHSVPPCRFALLRMNSPKCLGCLNIEYCTVVTVHTRTLSLLVDVLLKIILLGVCKQRPPDSKQCSRAPRRKPPNLLAFSEDTGQHQWA